MANYNGSAVLTLDGFKTAMTRVKTETLAAISKSGHAKYKKDMWHRKGVNLKWHMAL